MVVIIYISASNVVQNSPVLYNNVREGESGRSLGFDTGSSSTEVTLN